LADAAGQFKNFGEYPAVFFWMLQYAEFQLRSPSLSSELGLGGPSAFAVSRTICPHLVF